MDKSEIALSALPLRLPARVTRLTTTGAMRRRLLDLGLTPGASVTALLRARGEGIAAYRIRGAVIALRRADAGTVLVRTAAAGERPWA